MTGIVALLRRWFALLVWWAKHRIGFLDLDDDVTVTGTVVSLTYNPDDGDFVFNLRPDPGFGWVCAAFGGRVTTEDPDEPFTVHCEIVPWLYVNTAPVVVGARLAVRGAWAFDGVHVGYGTQWKETLAAIPAIVFGRQPNVRAGWLEIHPVFEVRRLP